MHTYLPSRGRVVVERRRVGEPVALAVADDAEPVVRGQRPLEDAQHRSVQRGVDHRAATAARVACVQRGDRGLRGEHAGEVVGDRDADAHRRAVGIAGEVEQPAVADADAVEPGPQRVRAVLAEHRDAHRDEPFGESVGPDVPLLERAGPEVLDDDVGGRREPAEHVLAFGRAQVEGDALAAAAFDRPEQRVTVDERADLAHEVAAARLFDLDDLGALLAEQPGAERRRDARAQIEDARSARRADRSRTALFLLHRVHAAGLARFDLGERGRRVRHELVEHEVVAPRLALAHAVDHVVDRRLHGFGGERRDERDLLGHLARRRASSARGTTRLTSP